jgi:hypothetical protein
MVLLLYFLVLPHLEADQLHVGYFDDIGHLEKAELNKI